MQIPQRNEPANPLTVSDNYCSHAAVHIKGRWMVITAEMLGQPYTFVVSMFPPSGVLHIGLSPAPSLTYFQISAVLDD